MYPGPQLDDPRQTDTTDMVLPEAEPAVKTVEDGFSYRALVLNRGLILAVMLLILAVGIILNLLITNLIT